MMNTLIPFLYPARGATPARISNQPRIVSSLIFSRFYYKFILFSYVFFSARFAMCVRQVQQNGRFRERQPPLRHLRS